MVQAYPPSLPRGVGLGAMRWLACLPVSVSWQEPPSDHRSPSIRQVSISDHKRSFGP